MTGIPLEYVKDMIAKGNVEGAIKSLASILKSNGRDMDAWLLLAEIIDDPVMKRDCYQQVLKWSPGNTAALGGLEELTSSTMKPPITASANELSRLSNRKTTFESSQTRTDNNHSQTRRQSKGYFMWAGVFSVVCIVFFILIIGGLNNIRDKQIFYWRSKTGSPNADIQIDLILKEYPSDLTVIYVENIIFTFKTGWTPHEKYLNGPFDIQTGDPERFAFYLNGYTTKYLYQGLPTTAMFGYFKADTLLNVDEWSKRDSCPFEKIQLQGLSADAKVELPDTLDIPFPCDLDSIKICQRYDPFFGGCAEYAP